MLAHIIALNSHHFATVNLLMSDLQHCVFQRDTFNLMYSLDMCSPSGFSSSYPLIGWLRNPVYSFLKTKTLKHILGGKSTVSRLDITMTAIAIAHISFRKW